MKFDAQTSLLNKALMCSSCSEQVRVPDRDRYSFLFLPGCVFVRAVLAYLHAFQRGQSADRKMSNALEFFHANLMLVSHWQSLVGLSTRMTPVRFPLPPHSLAMKFNQVVLFSGMTISIAVTMVRTGVGNLQPWLRFAATIDLIVTYATCVASICKA